jgi:uncharacterized protein (TIGR00288 family)
LSPWWLRPTSEGAANEEKDEKEDKQEQVPAAPATREGDAASRTLPESAAGTPQAPRASHPPQPHPPHPPHQENALRADQASGTDDASGAGAAAVAAAGAGGVSWAEPAAAQRPDTSHPAHQPAAPAQPEPYRAFWQPRETAPAPEVQPAAAAAPAPAVSWRSHEGTDAGRSSETAAPVAGSVAASGPRPLPAQVPAPFQPSEPAALEPSQTAETEADGEGEGEVEVEERDGESRPEVKKKRSRRSRGGRRKNGRAAASAPGSDLADEDDDDLDDESPVQFPAAPPPALPQPLAPRTTRGGESYVISGNDLDSMSREIIISVPDRQRPQHEERKIAVFCDFENIALGVRDSEISKFDIGLILERLLEKGKIIVKKAYADWERYSDYKRPFHEAAIELIDIPQKFYSGKNSADIKMVVDAMDLSYSKEHLDTFVILSGDSDFSPLVSKLKENNKYVIGIGVKNSSSNLLVDNCDEFIYYEDIWRDAQKGPKLDGLSKKTAEAFSLMVESIQALVRENKDVLWGSMIKQTMQRKKPSFNEGYYGYSTFSELLEDAERKNIVKLKKDQRSGTYIVTGFAKSGDAGPGRRQA